MRLVVALVACVFSWLPAPSMGATPAQEPTHTYTFDLSLHGQPTDHTTPERGPPDRSAVPAGSSAVDDAVCTTSGRLGPPVAHGCTTYDGTASLKRFDSMGMPNVGARSVDGDVSALPRPQVAANAGAQGARATLAEVNAIVPEGQTLGTWGSQIWGHGAEGAKSLIGTRSADELAQIPGLNVQSATVLRNFYQGAIDAGKGGTTAPIRVQLLDDIIKRMGG